MKKWDSGSVRSMCFPGCHHGSLVQLGVVWCGVGWGVWGGGWGGQNVTNGLFRLFDKYTQGFQSGFWWRIHRIITDRSEQSWRTTNKSLVAKIRPIKVEVGLSLLSAEPSRSVFPGCDSGVSFISVNTLNCPALSNCTLLVSHVIQRRCSWQGALIASLFLSRLN